MLPPDPLSAMIKTVLSLAVVALLANAGVRVGTRLLPRSAVQGRGPRRRAVRRRQDRRGAAESRSWNWRSRTRSRSTPTSSTIDTEHADRSTDDQRPTSTSPTPCSIPVLAGLRPRRFQFDYTHALEARRCACSTARSPICSPPFRLAATPHSGGGSASALAASHRRIAAGDGRAIAEAARRAPSDDAGAACATPARRCAAIAERLGAIAVDRDSERVRRRASPPTACRQSTDEATGGRARGADSARAVGSATEAPLAVMPRVRRAPSSRARSIAALANRSRVERRAGRGSGCVAAGLAAARVWQRRHQPSSSKRRRRSRERVARRRRRLERGARRSETAASSSGALDCLAPAAGQSSPMTTRPRLTTAANRWRRRRGSGRSAAPRDDHARPSACPARGCRSRSWRSSEQAALIVAPTSASSNVRPMPKQASVIANGIDGEKPPPGLTSVASATGDAARRSARAPARTVRASGRTRRSAAASRRRRPRPGARMPSSARRSGDRPSGRRPRAATRDPPLGAELVGVDARLQAARRGRPRGSRAIRPA